MFKCYFLTLVSCLFFVTNSLSQVKFKFNNVDTVSSINQRLINFFTDAIEARATGKNVANFWYSDKVLELPQKDSYESWIYGMYTYREQTILGLSKVSENHYKVKVMLITGKDSQSDMLYAIQNFIIKETAEGLRMQDILGFQIQKEDYKMISDNYFDFYVPRDQTFSKAHINEINQYVNNIERYFDKKVPYKLRYVYAPGCEALFRLRGYDYVANMMSTKSSVCGLTDAKNRIMFSSSAELHKHELLRLLTVIFPKSPAILMDGFTNLVGGAAGKPIMYHLRKLAPHILKHPEVLDDLDSFYYYDDETNPHFVFNAIVTNYFVKKMGEDRLKEFMKREDLSKMNVSDFLKTYCGIDDTKSFLLEQFRYYGVNEHSLENINILN